MTRFLMSSLTIALIVTVVAWRDVTAAAVGSCESLASLVLSNATVTLAQVVAPGAFTAPTPPAGAAPPPGPAPSFRNLPAFCRVAATLKPSSDSDIKIEVWLPAANWNGKFMGVGNGGFSGAIAYGAMGTPLGRGYAVASTDTGHQSSGADASWAFGHPEKQFDFGYRAVDPDLAAFEKRGGKLLQYHGWNDQQISAQNSINYYDTVVRHFGSAHATDDFYRLFMIPGMRHCRGGDEGATDQFDAIAALEQWVERHVAPSWITASHITNGVVDRTRPLCPYPQVATYVGRGSTDEAANFTCEAP